MPAGGAILALGRIAHDATLRGARRSSASALAFAHGARHALARGVALFDSYHCSRYNTNTRRLTRGDVPRGLRRASPRISAAKPRRAAAAVSARRAGQVRQRRSAAAPFDARELLASLPHRPGVYRMFDAAGETLYVGKARDLKKRVASYFQKGAHETRIALMLAQVARVETTVTRSEGEALLLENNLIKADEPRYNILFRDDKSYPYVCLTGETFPQLRFHRGKLDRQNRYFGPFPERRRGARGHGAAAEGVPAAHLREHGVRQPLAPVHAAPDRALQRALRRPRRRGRLRGGRARRGAVPAGQDDEVLAQLKAQMEAASAALAFERAARLRDKITRLTQLQSRQFVESATAGDIDVVAAAAEQGLVAVNVVMVRGGRHVGDRTFFPRHADAGALAEVVPAFLAQHYVERPVPPTIIAPGAEDEAALAEVLSAQAGQQVEIVGNPGGERRVWLAMATQNATFAIRQKLAQKATQEDRLAALQTGARPARRGAADRMLRRLAHDGRARRWRRA